MSVVPNTEVSEALAGQCSQCGKIWTLETAQGLCRWCGELSTCQTRGAQVLRVIKTRPRKRLVLIPASYTGLDGEWAEWLDTARRYETKIPYQDRPDYRHDCIIELHRARQRDGVPLPMLRQYRIASLMVALYWRTANPIHKRVCLYNGYATRLKCENCNRKPAEGKCPFVGYRQIESLDREVDDGEGHTVTLADTLADNNALDLAEWCELKTWLLGFPTRLVEIANKRANHIPLAHNDQMYLSRFAKANQKSLF